MLTDLTAISSADLCAELERRYRVENPVPPRAYYFGVWAGQSSGHFFVDEYGHGVWEVEAELGRIVQRENGLYPWGGSDRRPQVEGVAILEHHSGWTYLGFWDRSADPRGNCCSAFLLEGALHYEQAVQVARERFPAIWARYTFEVRRAV